MKKLSLLLIGFVFLSSNLFGMKFQAYQRVLDRMRTGRTRALIAGILGTGALGQAWYKYKKGSSNNEELYGENPSVRIIEHKGNVYYVTTQTKTSPRFGAIKNEIRDSQDGPVVRQTAGWNPFGTVEQTATIVEFTSTRRNAPPAAKKWYQFWK